MGEDIFFKNIISQSQLCAHTNPAASLRLAAFPMQLSSLQLPDIR